MKICGVTVLFEPDEKVQDNINSYIDLLDKLYLIDNTPDTDNSDLYKDNDKIVYIPNGKNLGIAKALNIGAKQAINYKADWLLTMDQDSSFMDDSLKKMISYIKNYKKSTDGYKKFNIELKKVGIISPLHLTLQNKNHVRTGVESKLIVMTSGNLVNLEAYKKIRGFKDWLFIDAVDFDFCLNLKKHNYLIIQLNYISLNHNLGETIEKKIKNKRMFVSNHSPFRRYFIVRNRHYIVDMYKKDFPEYCKAELSRTKRELLKIWLYENKKIKKSWEMFRGWIDYKKGIKGGYHGKSI